MSQLTEKYVNFFTDYGFKKIFGEELNKDLLIDFLNELLQDKQGKIKTLRYLNPEQLGATDEDRKAIFDLYCESETGAQFIVELQKTKQNFFKDRTVYYSTFPIRKYAEKSDWNYQLKPVYTIAILDFVFEEDKDNPNKYYYHAQLRDRETCKVFYDKLTFVYLVMPNFKKEPSELETHFDKWLYAIKNLNTLERVPEELRGEVFEKLFEVAEIAGFTPQQLQDYEESLKQYRDIKNSIDTARDEGLQEGLLKGKKEGLIEGKKEGIEEVVTQAIREGLSNELITRLTNLSEAQIEVVRKRNK